MSNSTAQAAPSTNLTPARLMSLDALRGFDMFWIIGAGGVVRALDSMGDNPVVRLIAGQLTHKDWEGFAFYDLIFPMFVFIVGVSLVFSLSNAIAKEGRLVSLRRVIFRGLLLVVVGIFYYGGFSNDWPGIRVLGVLQRIGLAYLFAGLIYCLVPRRAIPAIAAGILLGYWALMALVPIRDIAMTRPVMEQLGARLGTTNAMTIFLRTSNRVTSVYDKGHNLANHVDFLYLPGRLNDTYWDPEGLLSTLPAVASCLLGVCAGLLLRDSKMADLGKVRLLAGCGVGLVVLGFVWGTQFPVVKKIWSSSFVCVAGGYSCLLLAAFYLVVDVWRIQKWCRPFVWIGMNPITVYLAENLIGFGRVANRFMGGDIRRYLNNHLVNGMGDLLVAITGLALALLFCRFLYRRQIFIRL